MFHMILTNQIGDHDTDGNILRIFVDYYNTRFFFWCHSYFVNKEPLGESLCQRKKNIKLET